MIPNQQITDLLREIRRCMKLYHQIMQQELKKYNLTFVQIQVIRVLYQESSLSLRNLSKKIGSSMSSVSGVVDRLEKLQLVSRKRDQKDRRVVWITLTEKCSELIQDFPSNQSYFFRKYIGDMSVDEISQLTNQLKRLTQNLEKGIHND